MLSSGVAYSVFSRRFLLLMVFALTLSADVWAGTVASTIGGFVYDEQRNPVTEADVELLNENHATRARIKTNGTGRYEFNNVADGRYYVKVYAFRYNLEDDEQEVLVDTFSITGGGVSYVNADFYLKRKQGGLGETTTGVVFVQEVPVEAEGLYKDALTQLENKNTSEGVKKLIAAVQKFPDYYAAAQRLAMEFLKAKQYSDAAKMFIRAAEANPKSSKSFYFMAYSLSMIGKEYNRAALVALEKARQLAPNAYEVPLLVGKLQRQEGNLVEAEKNLLSAKKLASERVPEIHMELSQLYGNDLKQYGKAADELELYMKASDQKDEKIKKLINDLRLKAKRSS
jgi:tetratricopeptide (TPR) repeat protein